MVRKDFSRCFVNVYLPHRTINALTKRLNDLSVMAGEKISRSNYISQAINARIRADGYGEYLDAKGPEPTEGIGHCAADSAEGIGIIARGEEITKPAQALPEQASEAGIGKASDKALPAVISEKAAN